MIGDNRIKLYWRTVAILSAVIILSVWGLYLIRGNKEEAESEHVITENLESTENIRERTTITAITETESAEQENPLIQDAVFEINKLMEWFFQAKFDCNIETLQQIVRPIEEYSAERLYEERYGKGEDGLLEIESYHVQNCYSKRGLAEGTFFVWVYVDVKYVNADTPAPALYRMVVCSGENGYYIYNDVLEEEERVYFEEVSAMEDVQELVDYVNQLFLEVIEQDEQLREIVLTMHGTDSEEVQSSEDMTGQSLE